MDIGIIYKATSPSGKVYIGQTTKSMASRRRDHCANSRKPDHCSKLSKAIRCHGERMVWEIIYTDVPQSLLAAFEICVIEMYGAYTNGYNSTIGGDISPMKDPLVAAKSGAGHIGMIHSAETRQRMSQAMLGRVCSELTRQRMSVAFTGRIASESMKQKLAAYRMGSKHSDATKKKMSESGKGRKLSAEAKEKLSIAAKLRWEKKRNGNAS